ncbi:MAG: hypothetical protein QGI83_21965 [Candidatus Latescibacteria bacterium]|jgi:hypothetical protein|nr:hypothetical protein [Candidatus Latescibacterota bacterium]
MAQRKRLGEILLEKEYLTAAQLEEALGTIGFTPGARQMLGQILLGLGYVTQEQINEALAEQKATE